MAVKIRLARKGRKKKAFFHIVVADSRSPRDGRYIERLGYYNPLTNPATIEIDFDKALGWLHNGAIPTDTCRAILSYKGVLLKKHLLEGVKKGAFDEAEADRRFNEWFSQQEARIDNKKSGLEKAREEGVRKMLADEKRINEARSAQLAKKQAEQAARETGKEQEEIPTADVTEETTEITAAEEEPVSTEAEVQETESTEPAPEEKPQETESTEPAPEEKPQENESTEPAPEEKPQE